MKRFALQIVAKANAEGIDLCTYLYTPLFMSTYAACVYIHTYSDRGHTSLWFCFYAGGSKGKALAGKLPLLTGFAFRAGRSKGKGPGEKLPLLAVQCLEALLTLGRTAEGVAEVLQDMPIVEDNVPTASDAGAHKQCCFCHIA